MNTKHATDPIDLDAILAMTNLDVDRATLSVPSAFDSVFTFDYDKGRRPQLERLYEKGKDGQWNVERDLDWTVDVDIERVVRDSAMAYGGLGEGYRTEGTVLQSWGDAEWLNLGIEMQNWTLSQFMHGEQGALLCTSRIVETVPWIDAKYYAATQVVDEARHLEAFAKYLDTKLTGHYPINIHLQTLLDDILADSRWDITYLGMQVVIEGLALALFGYIRQTTTEPLLQAMLKYVMADEARHVAFGVLSLKELYSDLSSAEIQERQEFAYEAGLLMRDRFLQQEVWERLGLTIGQTKEVLGASSQRELFAQVLFSKIVPNCKKLGLLDAGDGWLRKRWTDIGVIHWEDSPDGTEEVDSMQMETS